MGCRARSHDAQPTGDMAAVRALKVILQTEVTSVMGFKKRPPKDRRELAIQRHVARALYHLHAVQHLQKPTEPPDRFRKSTVTMQAQEAAPVLEKVLAKHRGNIAAVAREMGTWPIQIRRWCKQLGIDFRDYRAPIG